MTILFIHLKIAITLDNNGNLLKSKKAEIASCIDCHQKAQSSDYVYLVDNQPAWQPPSLDFLDQLFIK